MRRLYENLKARVSVAIDEWMLNHGGNRELRLRNVARYCEQGVHDFIAYQHARSRTDDTVFGLVDPSVHYGYRGLDFVAQYLEWHGFKGVETSGRYFYSVIRGFGGDYARRRFVLPAFLADLNIELTHVAAARASQVEDIIRRVNVYRRLAHPLTDAEFDRLIAGPDWNDPTSVSL